MTFLEKVAELGYEIQPIERPYVKIKKRDEENIADVIMIFNSQDKTMSGGLITITPIKTINDIAHQYKVFREFDKDIKSFSQELGYDII